MSLIGYARVSTAEDKQLLDRQLDALNEIGCQKIFTDKASGSNTERPGLAECLAYLRPDDVLVVLDLDDSICPETDRRTLKKTNLSRTCASAG